MEKSTKGRDDLTFTHKTTRLWLGKERFTNATPETKTMADLLPHAGSVGTMKPMLDLFRVPRLISVSRVIEWSPFRPLKQASIPWNSKSIRKKITEICPGLNANEIQIPHDKYHEVSSLVRSHQNTHNSVKYETI